MKMANLEEIARCVVAGDIPGVKQMVQKALDEGESVEKTLNEGLLAGIAIIGESFKKGEFFIPEVMVAARTMKEGMAVLRPLLVHENIKKQGTIILGTVSGDLHDIGKNLVAMMLEGAGFEIINLGIDIPTEQFIQAAKENKACIIAVSALLTTTMPKMKEVVHARDESGLDGKIKILVGGAPVTQQYADEIGADGYAPDAASAMDTARELCAAVKGSD